MSGSQRVLALALGLVALVGASACSDDGQESLDLSGVELTVGSKNFTEQYVLSEILIQGLEAHGAQVRDRTDTGDTPTTREALESGEIDAYFEYNSTGWTVHLGRQDPPLDDGEELTDAVREADADNGIRWIGRSTFNNTYGFALSSELAAENQASRFSVEAFGLDELAELIVDDDLTVCIEEDFADRDDGLPLFEARTETVIPEGQLIVESDAAAVWDAVRSGRCDVSEVFTTDGLIAEFDREPVVDRGVFYTYNASLTITDDAYSQNPEGVDELVERILSPLSQSRMTELNRRVEAGEEVEEVAEDFVEEFVA